MEKKDRIEKIREAYLKAESEGKFKRNRQSKDVLNTYNLSMAEKYLSDLNQVAVIRLNDFIEKPSNTDINYLTRWLKIVVLSKLDPKFYSSVKDNLTYGIWDVRFTPEFERFGFNKRFQHNEIEDVGMCLKINVSDLINPKTE